MSMKKSLNFNAIAEQLSNLRQGDVVILDIDCIVYPLAVDKHGDTPPKLTDKQWPELLSHLKETKHPVIFKTNREEKFREGIIDDLRKLGLEHNALLHDGVDEGKALISYLNAEGAMDKSIHVIENNAMQLENTKNAFLLRAPGAPLFFYHYQANEKMLSHNDSDTFPDNLDSLKIIAPLGGGTQSTYRVEVPVQSRAAEDAGLTDESGLDMAGQSADHQADLKTKEFVLKLGAGDTQIKLEIMAHVLYQTLGVPVPDVQAYESLPPNIAEYFGLAHTKTTAQLAAFIEPHQDQDISVIEDAARAHFVAHALLGNIDVAKHDNFIVDTEGVAKLIDAGANFIYRALGQLREEDALALSELDTLRDAINYPEASKWFDSLTEDEMKEQAQHILAKHQEIEQAIWNTSAELELPHAMRDKLLKVFSERLDTLSNRFGFEEQPFKKWDKAAMAGITSAGVMYVETGDDGKLYTLLSKQADHNWCDTLGGQSTIIDETLLRTAQRNALEQSNGELYFSNRLMTNAAFHDLVTHDEGGQLKLHRMYFVKGRNPVDTSKMNHDEHSTYHWVAVNTLVNVFDKNQMPTGQDTLVVRDRHKQDVMISPSLCEMLSQPPVATILGELKDNLFSNQHTTNNVGGFDNDDYHPIASPAAVKHTIISQQLKKSRVLSDIKNKKHDLLAENEKPVLVDTDVSETNFSASYYHLKIILGEDYDPNGSIMDNVATFINKEHSSLDDEVRNRLIRQASEMIQREFDNPGKIFFYHGFDRQVAHAYRIYTAIYQRLLADESKTTLRIDHPIFHKRLNITEFKEYFQSLNGSSGVIGNYQDGFMQAAISANLFLFGNHNLPSSNTFLYYLHNNTASRFDFEDMLLHSFGSMGVERELVLDIIELLKETESSESGVLLQFNVDAGEVDEYAYLARSGGAVNSFEFEGQTTSEPSQLMNALQHHQFGTEASARDFDLYLKNVQARVMLPTNLSIESQMYDLFERDAYSDAYFELRLNQIADDVAYNILTHHHVLNQVNSTTAACRYLNLIQQNTGLSVMSDDLTDELIIQLLESGNYDLIQKAVEEEPAFLDKPIVDRRRKYTERTILQKEADKPQTLLQRLVKLSDATDVIHALYGEAFYETPSLESNVLDILQHTSSSKLSDLVMNHADKFKINCPLSSVLHKLPHGLWLDFAITHADKIQNGSDLGSVLTSLPEDCRLEFATTSADKVLNDFFGPVIDGLPEKYRIQFALTHADKIKNGYMLSEVLNRLPMSYRLPLATTYLEKIQDSLNFRKVLRLLSDESRLGFATLFLKNDTIKGHKNMAYFVVEALRCIKLEQRLVFASSFDNFVENVHQLQSILEKLPDECRLDFAITHAENVRITSSFRSNFRRRVIWLLPPENRLDFFKAYGHKLLAAYSMSSLISELPNEHRLDFAMAYADKIENDSQLYSVLYKLPDELRLDYAIQHITKFQNKEMIDRTIKTLSQKDRQVFKDKLLEASKDKNNAYNSNLFFQPDESVGSSSKPKHEQISNQINKP